MVHEVGGIELTQSTGFADGGKTTITYSVPFYGTAAISIEEEFNTIFLIKYAKSKTIIYGNHKIVSFPAF